MVTKRLNKTTTALPKKRTTGLSNIKVNTLNKQWPQLVNCFVTKRERERERLRVRERERERERRGESE